MNNLKIQIKKICKYFNKLKIKIKIKIRRVLGKEE